MSTTTIRLPEELKSRIAEAAQRNNQTPHSFILEAIAEKAAQEEQRNAFHGLAEQRYANITASGKTIPWAEMRNYLEARIDDTTAKPPRARKLAG